MGRNASIRHSFNLGMDEQVAVHHHHHSFNVSVPLKVGRMAPMFVLSFFLHSILLAGSALDSFQCLRSLLIVSFHVFFSLPRPRCPPTSNSVMLLIQPSFLTTCPNQHSRLYLNKVCMLLIPSFLSRESELIWSFKRTLHVHRIIARSLRCSLSRSLTLGAQHSLAYNKTVRIYVLYICPRVMYERAREVNIGKSSQELAPCRSNSCNNTQIATTPSTDRISKVASWLLNGVASLTVLVDRLVFVEFIEVSSPRLIFGKSSCISFNDLPVLSERKSLFIPFMIYISLSISLLLWDMNWLIFPGTFIVLRIGTCLLELELELYQLFHLPHLFSEGVLRVRHRVLAGVYSHRHKGIESKTKDVNKICVAHQPM